MSAPIRSIESRTVVLPRENVDTDQIIPARFLKVTDRSGLGKALFADWRYDDAGAPRPEFVLNRPEAQGCAILVAGDNFGCGSSREHAPWALVDAGVRAVISTRIADIFRANALKNGLVPVVVDPAAHARLLAAPGAMVRIDLERCTVTLPDGAAVELPIDPAAGEAVAFPIDPFARHCLLNGVDELGFLLSHEGAIAAYERSR